MAFWLLPIFILSCITSKGTHGKVLEEKRLINDLLNNYNKNVLPRLSRRTPIEVNLDIIFKRIIELEEAVQMLKTDIWLTQSWNNEFLKWNPDDYNGIKSINIQKSELWLPDTLLLNDVANDTSKHFFDNSTYVLIENNGRQQTYFPLISLTSCQLNLASFPFDEQTCKIEFTTWTNDVTRVVLSHPNNFSRSTYQESPAWELLSGRIYTKMVKYACCPQPFSKTTLEIKIRRNSLFYGIILLFPITMAWIPILLGFVAPTESGERASFSISVLLTLVFYMEVANQSLPKNSDHIPLYGKYYAGVVIIIVMSTFFTAIVTKFFYSKEYKVADDFNMFQKLLLRVGSCLPYIGTKCKALARLKTQHVTQLHRIRTTTTLSELTTTEISFQVEEERENKGGVRLTTFVNRIQQLDEGFVEDINDTLKQSSQSGLRKRSEQHVTDHDGGTRQTEHTPDDKKSVSKKHVTAYHKKLKTLKSISFYLAKIIRFMRKQKKKDIEQNKQVQYANAVVQLVDRVILTAFTTILVVWFMTTIGISIINIKGHEQEGHHD